MIAMVMVLLLRADGDLAAVLPTIGVFAFGTMRLMPAMQQVYGAFTNLRTGQRVLDDLHAEYTTALAELNARPRSAPGGARLPLREILELDDLSFAYPKAERPALRGVTLRIPAHSTVGIVGGTGAGKTTLIDLILGLLIPDSGEIRVDGRRLDRDTLRLWQQSLGYVPQSIYLVDDSVRANIAFGVPPGQIDDAAVERAARLAALHDFVTNELPEGYATVVGERGVRLSGGQRQRIGIARALYHEPDLLVFDEATSALDNITERVVMEAVNSMQGARTIILIAHRLSTVRNCDVIHLMEHGSVAASGTYDELVARNETFRRMATGS
jgi:ABC-type multidrug transport system fused ATPase/permease subunit